MIGETGYQYQLERFFMTMNFKQMIKKKKLRKLIRIRTEGHSLAELVSNQNLPVAIKADNNDKNIFMVYIS